MLIQVHGQERPAIRGRTIAAAVALLAISTGLAASMSWNAKVGRSPSVFVPRGWSVSFRPPAGARARGLWTDAGEGIQLVLPDSTSDGAKMYVLRLSQPAGRDPQVAAEGVLSLMIRRRPDVVTGLSLVWHDKRFGRHQAVEVWDPGLGLVVRAAEFASGELYAVMVEVFGRPPETYDFFDRFCRSFEDHAVNSTSE